MSSLVHETALIPSRLIMEHCMLVAVLHANVGTEVGAFVLQEVVQKFSEEHRKASDDEEASNAINNLLGRYIFIFYHLTNSATATAYVTGHDRSLTSKMTGWGVVIWLVSSCTNRPLTSHFTSM